MTGAEGQLVGGVPLVAPTEPLELKQKLRVALQGDGESGPGVSDDDAWLGRWLWEQWQPVLEPCGWSCDTLIGVVGGTRRELRLWLAGDRLWSQYLPGLVGRIGRRLPAEGTSAPHGAG